MKNSDFLDFFKTFVCAEISSKETRGLFLEKLNALLEDIYDEGFENGERLVQGNSYEFFDLSNSKAEINDKFKKLFGG